MTPPSHARLSIRPPRRKERRAALELALPKMPPEQRRTAVSATIDERQPETTGLFAAWRDAQLVGAICGEMQPGRVAVAHPPQTLTGEPRETGLALLSRLEEFFLQRGAQLYQIQLESTERCDSDLLLAAGLQCAGELLFLVIDLTDCEPCAASDVEFEPYREDQRRRLATVIEQTYRGSLDLPALDGVRSLDDVMEGYRRTGVHRPEFWRFVSRGRCDLGCLLLTEHTPQGLWELIYMGVTPEVRGQGLGREIVRYAKQLVSRAGGRQLVLAVDVRNAPACDVYLQSGFRPWRRTTVYLKVFATV